jgi:hypothetical protein
MLVSMCVISYKIVGPGYIFNRSVSIYVFGSCMSLTIRNLMHTIKHFTAEINTMACGKLACLLPLASYILANYLGVRLAHIWLNLLISNNRTVSHTSLASNIKLGLKSLIAKNALAYYFNMVLITAAS